jgi:ABC-2 type transport system ATP-binding protein
MSAPSVPRIEFDHVTKRYDNRAVVDNLTLSIGAGRIHCLVGPNGAGKTTTMHMLMGLRHPTSGEVRIEGVSASSPGIQSVRRRMGFLADQPDLYEDLTGREFLQFLAELYEVPSGGDRQEALIEGLALRDDLDRPLGACSLGVRKKIALLGALVADPAMLVLDEPTGALDAHAARAVKDLMRALRDKGRLVLFSTHMMEMAEQIADTISIIDAGRLLFSGSLAELRARHGREPNESLEDIFLRLTARPGTTVAEARTPVSIP